MEKKMETIMVQGYYRVHIRVWDPGTKRSKALRGVIGFI